MADKIEIDAKTGRPTTGHEWDGIKELNTPLQKWWLYVFYATIVWGIGYWILFPAWPTLSGYTPGVLGTTARQEVARDLASAAQARAGMVSRIERATLDEIVANRELSAFAQAQGRMVFQTACVGCHGSGGAGAVGYPNLNDDNWIWGGKLDDIHQTIRHGIRWTADGDTRQSQMPAFGRDGLLQPRQIELVADYVRSLSGNAPPAGTDLAAGRAVYAENCASCHGDDARGNRDMGAPNLAAGIWTFGGSRAAVIEGIRNGRAGQMPPWVGRLDEASLKAVTVYVHGLGGGER
jgi:cytochrome c oxidase cbb3-type subunit III